MDVSNPSVPAPAPQQVTIIRLALFMGVAIFGVVCWFVLQEGPPKAAGQDLSIFMYVFVALLAGAVGVAAIMKRKQAETAEWPKRVSFSIIGWAACEACAIFGGVYWLMTGDFKLYIAGALLLVGALILLAPKTGDEVV